MRISVEDTRTGKVIKLDVKEHHLIEDFRIIIKMINAAGVERTGPPDDPVDLITFFQK